MLKTFPRENVMYGRFPPTEVFCKLRRGRPPGRPAKFYISHLARRGGYYPPVVKPHRLLFCHSERVKRRGILLPQNQNSVILNTEGVKNLCSYASTNSFYAALALLLVPKVTKSAGKRSVRAVLRSKNTSLSCECSGAIPPPDGPEKLSSRTATG